MANISASFDVKISIVRPFITKDLSFDDITKIKESTTLKYETIQTKTPEGSLEVEEDTEDEIQNNFDKELNKLEELYQGFDAASKRAEEAMKKIAFTYDTSDPALESLADAEATVFGSATGIITFEKYKKLLAYEDVINRELQESMVESGGQLDVG
jgi:hypothetical protein